jgi:hypothetical protein
MKHLINSSKLLTITSLSALLFFSACKKNTEQSSETSEVEISQPEIIVYDTNTPKTIIEAIAKACGEVDNLKALNDVQFDYYYERPDGKKDVSIERYIFDNEISWARYTTHQVNVFPEGEGDVIQFYDGTKCSLYNNGTVVEDSEALGFAQFLRQANFMWFNMMFKFGDPGTVYEYLGQETLNDKTYDKLKVTYDPEITGKEENDIYVLFVNPETNIVDQFTFSLPLLKVYEPVLLAKLTYTEIDGIKVISRREMFMPSEDGSEMLLMLDQHTKNVKFNNGFTAEQLSKEIL